MSSATRSGLLERGSGSLVAGALPCWVPPFCPSDGDVPRSVSRPSEGSHLGGSTESWRPPRPLTSVVERLAGDRVGLSLSPVPGTLPGCPLPYVCCSVQRTACGPL